jgi:DNA invertase Pin-like site-specific DNA recombinase
MGGRSTSSFNNRVSTPGGKALFQMMGVFAEFERAMIQERVRAGIARVRASAKTNSGKSLGRPNIEVDTEKRIRAALQAGGEGFYKIAKKFGVGTGTVQRIKVALPKTHIFEPLTKAGGLF